MDAGDAGEVGGASADCPQKSMLRHLEKELI